MRGGKATTGTAVVLLVCPLAHQRKLTAEQEAAIRALAAMNSLGSLADEFGVSHETVRKVVRKRQAAGAA